jgi:deoxyribodipyrimidine photolyase-like uncharacterized protein
LTKVGDKCAVVQDRGRMTAADLQRVTGVDVLENDIVNQLRNNVKVDFNPQAGTYAYKVRRTLVSQCLHTYVQDSVGELGIVTISNVQQCF